MEDREERVYKPEAVIALSKQCSLHTVRQMNVQTDMAVTAQARQDPGVDSGGGHEVPPSATELSQPRTVGKGESVWSLEGQAYASVRPCI